MSREILTALGVATTTLFFDLLEDDDGLFLVRLRGLPFGKSSLPSEDDDGLFLVRLRGLPFGK